MLVRVGSCSASLPSPLIALGGCSQAPAPPPAAKLFTLFDVQSRYATGAGTRTEALAADDGLPGGIPLRPDLASPPASDGTSILAARTAWSNSDLVAFLTTEVWANYPEVWMQPAYVPITGWVNGKPQLLGGTSLQPIFSVGASSGFYGPFWQIVYAEVPPDTAPGALTSARQILDGGFVLTPGEGRTMPLVPPKVGSPSSVDLPTKVVAQLPSVLEGRGFFAGTPVSYLDFGPSLFTWDSNTNVVQEAPIYVLTFVDSDGSVLASPSIPTDSRRRPARVRRDVARRRPAQLGLLARPHRRGAEDGACVCATGQRLVRQPALRPSGVDRLCCGRLGRPDRHILGTGRLEPW